MKSQCICDACKKVIFDYERPEKPLRFDQEKYIHYWEISTSDNSPDSFEFKHACSLECLCAIMLQYAEESNEYELMDCKMEIESMRKIVPIKEETK